MINLTNKALFYVAAASTFIAGMLHLAIILMFYKIMPMNVTIFFLVSGAAQLLWVVPVLKRWSNLWYYIGIGGTVILIIIWIVAVPGSGYPVDKNQVVIEALQIIFIICSITIVKDRTTSKQRKESLI